MTATRERVQSALAYAVVLVLMITAGSFNSHNAFSAAIKTQLNYTQLEIDVSSSAGSIGFTVAPFAGMLVDRCAQRAPLAVALAMHAAGYVLGVGVMDRFLPSSFALMFLSLLLCAMGTMLAYMTALLTITRNVPERWRGAAVSVSVVAFSASASAFAALYGASFGRPAGDPAQHNVGGMLMTMGFIAVLGDLLGLLFLRYTDVMPCHALDRYSGTGGGVGIGGLSHTLDGLGAYSGELQAPVEALDDEEVVVFARLASSDQLAAGVKGSRARAAADDADPDADADAEFSPLDSERSPAAGARLRSGRAAGMAAAARAAGCAGRLCRLARSCRAMCSAEFVALLAVCATVGAVCDLYWTNVAFVLQAAGQLSTAPVHVVLLPVCSTAARLAAGLLSDALRRRWHVPRAGVLAGAPALLLPLLPFLIAVTPGVYVAASVLVGLAQGVLYALGPTLTAERFGLEQFGRNWGVALVVTAASEFALNVVSARMYSAQIAPGAGTPTVCLGSTCYRWSFVTCLALMLPCALCTAYLWVRAWRAPAPQPNVAR